MFSISFQAPVLCFVLFIYVFTFRRLHVGAVNFVAQVRACFIVKKAGLIAINPPSILLAQ